jgi:DNA-binding NarL/FixJ family response regulator
MVQHNPYGLTFREFTVLHHIARGLADKEIAEALGISAYTVNKHVAAILSKMEVTSRTAAGVRAVRDGVL